MLVVWLPLQEDETVQPHVQGQGTPYGRYWTDALHEDHDPTIQEWIPGGYTGQEDDQEHRIDL
eukprot:CAMPEP_0113450490 /NCGR_PEP_ID=MMETSP0014_2-20120614/5855_1 /TAXON_ID=2857 /ORGANISM="Nitzschia sp." /LENGTH=62 /DNA_ID=CAMNT_0000341827 /DNA_START=404 /DNA_END=588 /DNA_ORIENTATION=- /assembly_acc=CAM_ASM_000159